MNIVIIKENLDRHQQVKVYFDVEELRMMVEQTLKDTKVNGCASGIQRITLAVISFMTGLHPS